MQVHKNTSKKKKKKKKNGACAPPLKKKKQSNLKSYQSHLCQFLYKRVLQDADLNFHDNRYKGVSYSIKTRTACLTN